MIQEFKKFLMRGNVVDLAVGIIIGAAFGKIVESFVRDILMPPLGYVLSGIDFSMWSLKLDESGRTVIHYGAFLNNVVQFLIIGFAVFLLVKTLNKIVTKAEKLPPPPNQQEILLREIRDLLAKNNHKASPTEE